MAFAMSGSSEARKRGHDDDLEPGSEVLEHGKRRRVNGSSLCSSTPSSPSPAQTDKLPDLAVLYHAAISAHNSAHYHLQQAFVPAYIEVPQDEVLECTTPAGRAPFTHDPHAMSAALRCLVMALDLLHAGLHTPRISDKEYAAFGLEFTVVALKLLGAMDALKTLSEADRARVGIVVDVERLGRELEDSLPKFVSTLLGVC